jgi:prephenate dehydrogenase
VIVRRAAELRLPFVGGHPMAGRELAGYQAAEPELFVDRPWVVCERDATQEAVKRVEELARDAGARPIHLDPDVHDSAVAAVSHLPLVVSAALVEAVVGRGAGDWREARPLAAGGWQSMTRLAGGEVEMGAGILATNADNVAQRLTALRAVIDDWITLLGSDAPDVAALRGRLESAKRTLELDSG